VKRPALSVELLPVLSTVLLEWANIGQLIRMWTERTAAGQSLQAWVSVCLALLCFLVYYHKKGLRVPFWTTIIGVLMNIAVCSTVVYFRFFAL
jgi:uncharacterized protein with PQ loop repeat